jgi:hypothetical protein
MIRGVSRSGRIAWVVGVVVALAVAAPAAAGAQSAVEEYSLDIPGGGGGTDSGSGGGTDSGTPTSGTPSTGATASGTPSDTSSGGGAAVESSSGGDEGNGADPSRADKERRSQGHPSDELDFSGIHDGGSNALDTNSRSAPEVVADTLLDGAMLPILAALVLITGVGAWRVLHSRGALSRQAG